MSGSLPRLATAAPSTSPDASRARGPTDQPGRLHGLGDHCHDLVPRAHVHQIQIELRRSNAGEVPMSLDEPRDDELPVHVDDLRGRSDVRPNVATRSDCHYPIAGDSDCLCLRLALLHGDDTPVGENKVGGADGLSLRGAAGSENQRHEEHQGSRKRGSAIEHQSHGSGKSLAKLPPMTRLRASCVALTAASAATWASWTGFCQPRGKKEESVPNSRRSGPATASAC